MGRYVDRQNRPGSCHCCRISKKVRELHRCNSLFLPYKLRFVGLIYVFRQSLKSFDQTFSKVCGVERRSLSSPASQRAKSLCRKKAQERSKTIEYCFAWKTLAGGFPLRDSANINKYFILSVAGI